MDHLYDFAAATYRAKTSHELDAAADHLSKAIVILGVQSVLAIIFRGMPRTGPGSQLNLGVAPLRGPGLRYRPVVQKTTDPGAPAGVTSNWGDIMLSTHGTATERAVTLLHEKVHQFLTPKLYLLRDFRVNNRVSSYAHSSLSRYFEEALAETIAQVGIHGISRFFVGIRFPVRQGYVYLTRGGGFRDWMSGRGVVPEGAGLLCSGIVMGIGYQLWFSAR